VAYTIEWRKFGTVTQFTGTVSFDEVMQSEREITGHTRYTELWYVVFDFSSIQYPEMTESEIIDLLALRLGGFWSNPRIKFAFVTDDLKVKYAIEKSVFDGHARHSTHAFKTMDDAMAWATVL
jgi:hypothetical protein